MFCLTKKHNRVFCGLYLCWLLVSWFLVLFLPSASASEIDVVFVSPQPKMPGFWQHYEDVMQSAASDLKINLQIIRSVGSDRFGHIAKLQQATEMQNKPDYLITMPREATVEKMFSLLKASDIKFFITNTELPHATQQDIGEPGQKYENWIGHLRPDDVHAGRLLASELHDVMGRRFEESKYSYIAITGARDVSAVFHRNLGLRDFIEQNKNSRLLQFVFTDWRYKNALAKVPLIVRRYPDLSAVWCASDEIATAMIDGYANEMSHPQPFIGSIDWSQDGLIRYRKGSLSVSVGGHIIEGGLLLALIRDHYDGIEFINSGMLNQKLKMSALSADKYPLVEELVVEQNYQALDFSKLSVSLGGSLDNWAMEYWKVMQNIQRTPIMP